ncbi:Hint domain-containing protein [Paracoccus kondratievae]|uniref:Hint domain-containing protein n=1 Tax=Paracoccus kondratievae TaxID=135740 RepID=UPI001D0D7FBE|nr:Hint domain-containing protein [Paracoccus kondratievae]
MPYITEIPSSFITVGLDGIIAFVPNTSLLNAFEDSQEFAQYDVDANGATTLENGDNVTPVDTNGDPLTGPGTYLGSTTVSNAAVSVGLPPLAAIGLQVNPISGHIMEADGRYYFISDEPLDDDHLAVTASIVVAGQTVSVTAPISQITETLAAAVEDLPLGVGILPAATIRAGADLIQQTANTAIVTMDHDPNGTLELSDDEVFCFVAGTLIETENGFVPVETLQVGDKVMTRDNGLQPIRWIGSIKLKAAALKASPKLMPIRIRAGALGDGVPSSDLLVSPQHRVLVRSKIAQKMFGTMEVLVAAKQLLQLDGVDIATDLAEVEYFHILFERHEVVNSNGALTESLYTGPQALRSVGKAAREEIFALFPQLSDADFVPEPARMLPSGRKARKLTVRHRQHHRPMVC